MHKIFTIFLLLYTITSYSQDITIKGKITDSDNLPLEAATIYLTSVKDSTVIDYTISNKNGVWELKTRKLINPILLKVSYVGLSNYKQEVANILEDRDFGTIKLADKSTELNEVVIQSEIPPIRIKKDTLEFNASSFKVRPDANVEALLKKLPGVEIDSDGKITVNGKEVNQVLINGKAFFDKDGKIALQNLPADVIDKVQITDTKTKKEELAGQKAKGDNASINLTIQKDKNKGVFGKIMGGYGSSDRYESSALINYFKDSRKISFLASSNNINSSGFSMNELFDSMGGGRNISSLYSSGVMNNGVGRGITKSDMIGANYSDEWFKDAKTDGSYFYTSSNTENRNRTESINYLPLGEDPDNQGVTIDKSYTTKSISNTNNDKSGHTFTSEFDIKIDSTSTLNVTPKFASSTSKSSTSSERSSERLSDSRLLNESTSNSFSDTDNKSFTNEINYRKNFSSRKGRGISITLENENNKDDNKNLNKSNTIKYKYPDGTAQTEIDNRDQILYNKQADDNYIAGIEYEEPITDSLRITLGTVYSLKKSVESRNSYDFEQATGNYSKYNDALSNYINSKTGTLSPRTGISFEKGKFNLEFEAGTDVISFKNYAFYMSKDYNFNKVYILPSVDVDLTYKPVKGKSISVSYTYRTNLPQAQQVLEVEDISNPLNTYIGNPNLDPAKYHFITASYRNYNTGKRTGFNIYFNARYYDNEISSFTITDESAKNITSYKNISGAMYNSLSVNWNKSVKRDAHNYRLNLGLSSSYNIDKGFLNGELYDTKSVRITPRVNFTYEYGELLTINPSYSFTYNESSFSNYTVNSASNFLHTFSLQTTTYWPKHVVFGNDFGYTYNSNIADGFKKDFYLWNTSIGYNFLNDELLFKVKVYDLLNQNTGTSRTIGPTNVMSQENTVLKRYIMFSLTYKIGKFGGGNKKRENTRMFHSY